MIGQADKHPLFFWGSIIFGLFTLATSVAGGWYFILDERERSIEQTGILREIRGEQEEIRQAQTIIRQTLLTLKESDADLISASRMALLELGRLSERTRILERNYESRNTEND